MAQRRLSRRCTVCALAMASLLLGGSVTMAAAQTPVVVDLLILYTPAVRVAEGGTAGAQARAAERVAEINQALTRSETNTQIRLVGPIEVPYVESGSSATDSTRLDIRNDGYMDDVDALRASVQADLVMLIINVGTFAGAAANPQPPSLKTTGSFTSIVIGFSFVTMAHELGHLFGLSHFYTRLEEIEDNPLLHAPTFAAGDIGFGYGPLGGVFHTIVANVEAPPYSTFVPVYSSPRLTEQGATLGNATLADSARAIGESAPMVAAYSETACQYVVAPAMPVNDLYSVSADGQAFTYTVSTAAACLTGIRIPDTRWITRSAAVLPGV